MSCIQKYEKFPPLCRALTSGCLKAHLLPWSFPPLYCFKIKDHDSVRLGGGMGSGRVKDPLPFWHIWFLTLSPLQFLTGHSMHQTGSRHPSSHAPAPALGSPLLCHHCPSQSPQVREHPRENIYKALQLGSGKLRQQQVLFLMSEGRFVPQQTSLRSSSE